MELYIPLFWIFLLAPLIVGSAQYIFFYGHRWNALCGVFTSFFSCLILIFFLSHLLQGGAPLRDSAPFLPMMGIAWEVALTSRNAFLLLIFDACFLVLFLLFQDYYKKQKVSVGAISLLIFFKGLISFYVVCENLLLISILHIVISIVLFLLLRLFYCQDIKVDAGKAKKEMHGELAALLQISGGIVMLLSLVSLSFVFEMSSLNFSSFAAVFSAPLSGATFDGDLWTILFLVSAFALSLPLCFWSAWFMGIFNSEREEKKISSIISIPFCIFMGAILFIFNEIVSILPKESQIFLRNISIFGFFMAIFSGYLLCAAGYKERALGSIIVFFLGMAFYSIGFFSPENFQSVYLISITIPVLSVFIRFLCDNDFLGSLNKATFLLIFVFLVSIPGTPVYYIFALPGAVIFDSSLQHSILLVLLWTLYSTILTYCGYRIFFFDHGFGKDIDVQGKSNSKGEAWQANYKLATLCLFFCLISWLGSVGLLGFVY